MENNKYNNIRELFIKLLPIQIFISAASFLSSLVNGLITGNFLSSEAMVALGLIMPMSAILAAIAAIVSGGAGIICGKLMGKGEVEKVNNVFSTSIISLTVIGATLSILIYLSAGKLALLFGAEASAISYTTDYIRGLSFGIIPQLYIPTCMTFLQMCNKSKVSLVMTIVLAAINACLGILNVTVINGGIFGIGASTSLSNFLVFVIIALYFAIKKNLVKFKIRFFNKGMVLDILKYGSPACLCNALYAVRNVFLNTYALEIQGPSAVNALAILNSCGFQDSICIGFGSTFSMLCSVFVGERDSESLFNLCRTSFIIGESIQIVKTVLIFIFAEKVTLAFGATGEAVYQTKNLLSIYSLSAPLNTMTLILIGSNQSLGNVAYCNGIYIVNCIIAPLLCCMLLPSLIGILAVYSCFALSEAISISLMIIISCFINKKPVKSYKDLIHFPDNFEIEDKISMSINNVEGVVTVSKKIQDFLLSKGIDSRRSMLAGLCMEESASNVVEHGFIKDDKENTVDIFAYIENDEISMRLRDNCVPFNPKERLEAFSNDDPFKNIGIKMVSKIAKEMNYQTTFGMNILTIKL